MPPKRPRVLGPSPTTATDVAVGQAAVALRVHLGAGCAAVSSAFELLARRHGIQWVAVTLPTPHPLDVCWVLEEDAGNRAGIAAARAASVLHNVGPVLSWKSSLALLQRQCELPRLDSFVLVGIDQVELWCRSQWSSGRSPRASSPAINGGWSAAGDASGGDAIWMLKDALSNSGRGIWVLSRHNWRSVVERARSRDATAEFVAQRYIADPELWGGAHKYHLRVYAALTGDLGMLVHGTCFAHVANSPFALAFDPMGAGYDPAIHITNVAANVDDTGRFHGYPQLVLPRDRPEVWRQIIALMGELRDAAKPFIGRQRRRGHFAHLGCDFMIDAAGTVFLIEINVPPCIGSQSEYGEDDKAVSDLVTPSLAELVQIVTADDPTAVPLPHLGGWAWAAGPSPGFVPTPTESELAQNTAAWAEFEQAGQAAMVQRWRPAVTEVPAQRSVDWGRPIDFAGSAAAGTAAVPTAPADAADAADAAGAFPATTPPPPRRGILFDMDGTLSLTDHLHHVTYRKMLPRIGYDAATLDADWFAATVSGRANADVWRSLMPAGSSDTAITAMIVAKEAAFLALAEVECTPLPGLLDLLAWCDSNDVACCVVTNAPRTTALQLLAGLGLGDRFGTEMLICGMECAHTKPHPAPYCAGLALLGCDPEHCIAFEDSPSGVRSAVAAGIDTVGILSTTTAAALAAEGTCVTVADYTDTALLGRIASKLSAAAAAV